MPLVKFDYIVSFSSEDPEHPASNLLSREVSKKKWLCAAGENSASVVLQLDKAVQIGTVAVGAHHAALVEVLVGRSETPAEPYQVLVPSCVFLSPSESRKAEGAAVERVRSFTGTEGVWAQRWDRVRLLISQPYNKHCKFGVSFVHVFSPDGDVGTRPTPAGEPPPSHTVAEPARLSLLTALNDLSSDEEFKPGELFTQHKLQVDTNTTDTGSQIRRASSQLLRTSESTGPATTLVKTARTRTRHTYTHTKDNKQHDPDISTSTTTSASASTTNDRTMDADKPDLRNKRKLDTSTRERDRRERKRKREKEPDTNASGTTPPHTEIDKSKEIPNKYKSDTSKQKRTGDILGGVVCVLSGYENPRRAAVRSAALALGARVLTHWDHNCTHLICAFPRTPKLLAVRSAAGGVRVPAVLADWVEECARLGRRLPEEWFSTEPARRVPPAPPDRGLDADEIESEDTDDEIGQVLRRERETRDESRDTSPPPTVPHHSDVAFVTDYRIQGSVSDDYDDTTDVERTSGDDDDDEAGDDDKVAIDVGRTLPPLLRDMVFLSVGDHVDRYVRAYGGTLVHHPLEEEDVVYALCEEGAGAEAGAGVRRLRLRWLWRAHRDLRLPPLHPYILD